MIPKQHTSTFREIIPFKKRSAQSFWYPYQERKKISSRIGPNCLPMLGLVVHGSWQSLLRLMSSRLLALDPSLDELVVRLPALSLSLPRARNSISWWLALLIQLSSYPYPASRGRE
jgi:hypothetical protein